MASIFTRIIDGEIPGRIVWRDATCVAMVDIRPLNRGHVLVIPITEVDRWTDLPAEVVVHCTGVAHAVGRAQMAVLSPTQWPWAPSPSSTLSTGMRRERA